MCEPNLYSFMGEHWLLTLILAFIFARVVCAPIAGLILAIAWRIMGKRPA